MPRQTDNENVYPAGDMPPEVEDDVKNSSDSGHADADKTNKGDDSGSPGADYETRYKNLEKKLGEQGNEMGQLKQQNKQLVEQLEQMKSEDQGKPKGDQQAPGYEAKMNEITKQLEAGDISVEEAFRQSNTLTRQASEQVASARVKEALAEKEQEEQVQRFFKDHPDFQQLKESGELEGVKEQMPGFHDDFSAYFAYKAQQAEKTGYEKGRQEMEALAQGDANTDQVLRNPGSAIRNQNPETLTDEGDIKDSMMQRLKEARKT